MQSLLQKLQQEKEDQLLIQLESDIEQEPYHQTQQQQDQQPDPFELYMNSLQTHTTHIPPPPTPPPTTTTTTTTTTTNHYHQHPYQNQAEMHPQDQYQFVGRERNDDEQMLSNEEHDAPEHKPDKRIIQVLKPFDFSGVELEQFDKNFYEEHQQITNLGQNQVNKILKQLQIRVSGAHIPRPIVSFGHLPFDQTLRQLIVKNQFEKPTPIQSIALPAALSGRDVVAIAKTGSGKTLAYVWPMIVHVVNQSQSKKGDGPIAIVLAPTRQLCQQIYVESRKYSKKFDLKIGCLLGGQNKHDQWKMLKVGLDILVASPGRLIEMLKKKATNLLRVTYLVIDEADRMLSLGFQQQIRSIVNQTRQDRQTLLFTATMKKSMQLLAGDVVSSPVRINIGEEGAANQNIKQQVVVIAECRQKWEWLRVHLNRLVSEGKVLIFANQKQTCQEIGQFIQKVLAISALVLHGSKNQYQRTVIMNGFKSESAILVATDIAARGIDVKNIKTVINFECPKQVEAYIHRIGRSGRAGQTGISYTFLTTNDVKFAMGLVSTFQNSGYSVPQQLEDLACLDDFFKRKRLSSKMGVSFAKGKDASKFLNQILKKQRMGYNKAGLGMEQPNEKSTFNKPEANILYGQKDTANLSISQLSAIIRQKHQSNINREEKFGQFYLSSKNDLNEGCKEVEVVFSKPKPSQVHP